MAARWLGHSASSASSTALPPGPATSQSANAPRRSMRRSTGAWEWSAQMITAWVSRNRSSPPAASATRTIWASAAAIDVGCACGPFLWE